MFDFCKLMFQLGCPIEGYVPLDAITPEQYKQITGKDYVPATQTAPAV